MKTSGSKDCNTHLLCSQEMLLFQDAYFTSSSCRKDIPWYFSCIFPWRNDVYFGTNIIWLHNFKIHYQSKKKFCLSMCHSSFYLSIIVIIERVTNYIKYIVLCIFNNLEKGGNVIINMFDNILYIYQIKGQIKNISTSFFYKS